MRLDKHDKYAAFLGGRVAELPTFEPLALHAFGRTWQMTPWFEPIWRTDGSLMALELLSRFYDERMGVPISAEHFFTQAPLNEQMRALRWQLKMLTLLKPWNLVRRVPVSLNLSRPLATLLLADVDLCAVLAALAPWLKLEIHECFLMPNHQLEHDPLLATLGTLAPLWLDDFGMGSTSLAAFTSGRFKAIKLDKSLMKWLLPLPEGERFLTALTALARASGTDIIMEGVESEEQWRQSRTVQVTACQGWRWKGVTLNALHNLPERLPMVTT